MAVASPLLKTVAIGVSGMLGPVLAPVVATACGPGSVRLSLIGAVIGIALQLDLLPAAPALALTGCHRAIPLLGNLRTRLKRRAARRAPTALHGCLSAPKKHGA
jgi:hypothetical protein